MRIEEILGAYALIAVFVLFFALIFWFVPALFDYQDSYTESGKRYAARQVVKAMVSTLLIPLLWPVVIPAWLARILWKLLDDAYGKKG